MPPISEAIRGWWNRIKPRLYERKEIEFSPRTCSIGKSAGGTLCPHPITLINGVVDRPWVVWVVGSNSTSTIIKLFQAFSHVELEKYSPPVYPGNETAWMIDRSARISGRPAISPFQGGRML